MFWILLWEGNLVGVWRKSLKSLDGLRGVPEAAGGTRIRDTFMK